MAGHHRGQMLRRMALLLLYCRNRRYAPSIRTMARGLDVHERTVRRYLATMEEVGFELPKWRDEVEP